MRDSHARLFVCLAALSLAVPAPSAAGPNANGTLIVHDAGFIYSDMTSYCGVGSIPSDCEHVDARIDMGIGTNAIWKVYAAFPPCGSSPRLGGVYFGVQYDPEVFVIQAHACGDSETPTPGWPASGTGLQVTWSPPHLGWFTEVCWFAGYSYPAPFTADFRVLPHPTAGGWFVDDSQPPLLDPVMGYGTLGFNQPGQLVCGGWHFGACCHGDGTCSLTTAEGCDAPDVWFGCQQCLPEVCWILDSGDPRSTPDGIRVRMTPNPMREQAVVEFRTPAAGATSGVRPSAITIGIYDAAGRQIRQIYKGEADAGSQSIPWDGRNDEGRLVPAGAYYLRLETAGRQTYAPAVVLR